MIVGVPTRSLPVEENLKTFKKIGFDGFQFDLSSCGIDTLKKGFLLEEEEDKCVEEIKNLSDKLKFPVLALHTFYPLNADENVVIKTFEKNLEYLKILNCKYLILHISGYCDDKKRLNQAITCLKKIENLYEKSGSEILLENDHKPSLFITIKDIEKVNAKLNFNLCFDTTHAMQSDVDVDEFWKKFNNKIKAIHLSDFKDGKAHKEIGTGILQQFESYVEIINSDKLLILEVGKDFKRAKSKEEAIKVWENSFLEVSKK
ncbi:MAG: sugar phosphate isomerase/epimerase [Candidatus Pacearchaeota archaeon]|nr:sugar phosphate isomerase/epimerase [Candidatus Pacearchaeota archaeon]